MAGSADLPALNGTLVFVDNAVDTTTGTILLKGRFDNAEGVLWPGQFVTATLVLYVEKAVVVPQPAVMIGDRGNYVFMVDDKRQASTKPVETGRMVSDMMIVTKGLGAGDIVVTDGQLRLIQGAKVDVKNADEVGMAPDTSKAAAGDPPGGAGRGKGSQPGAGGQGKRGGGGRGQRPAGGAGGKEATQ